MRTAEFVSPKHPDKMCDQISDAILDHCLKIDPYARVAIETLGGHGKVYVVGELTINDSNKRAEFELDNAIHQIVNRVTGKANLLLETNIVRQSREIAGGVDTGGAGDQGIMRGYAVRDTENLMPLEYELARSLCEYLYERHPYDGKTQITLDENGLVQTIVASFQNTKKERLVTAIEGWVDIHQEKVRKGLTIHANPAGDWGIGGFDADTGLTGRKLAVDNYGPRFPIGGGAFSGKDATKVDRSAAYMARLIAVEELLASEPEVKEVHVELAYAIGVAEPVAVRIERVREGGDKEYLENAQRLYDLTPKGIIEYLRLRQPQYEETARRGHFGKGNTWDVATKPELGKTH